MNWYVLHVTSNQMEFVNDQLVNHGLTTLLPKVEKWFSNSHIREYVTSLLFPDCVFVYGMETDIQRICTNSSLIEEWHMLSDSEATVVQAMFSDTDVIRHSVGTIENMVLTVSDGPLMGMESKVTKIDRHKRVAYVDMQLLGRSMRLPLEVISKS